MAKLGQTFITDDMPKGNGYDPVPPGWYNASITEANLSDTKDGTGQYIKVRYDITGPTHPGRVVFGNFNIKNKSAKAEEIGMQQLGYLCRAIGLSKISDTDELLGASLQIKLSISKQEGYEDRNEVKGFKKLDGVASVPAPARAAPAASAPTKAAPPWQKKAG